MKNNDEKITVKSKALYALDKLGIAYRIKGMDAQLLDHDSLHIQLNEKYLDHWKRWSTGDFGNDAKSLIYYLVQDGLIDITDSATHKFVQEFLYDSKEFKDKFKKIKTEKARPFNYDEMVTNPNHFIASKYLENVRHLNSVLVQEMFNKGLIVQDGRDNIRFLWKNADGKFVGAEVQGTRVDYEKFGKRGTLKMTMPGSKCFFNVSYGSEIQEVYLFEATIDLLSYIELLRFLNKPLDGKMFISMSGSVSKVVNVLNELTNEFGIDFNQVKVHFATDNDDAGNSAYLAGKKWLTEHFSEATIKRNLPHNGADVMIDGVARSLKDWNEYLVFLKGGAVK